MTRRRLVQEQEERIVFVENVICNFKPVWHSLFSLNIQTTSPTVPLIFHPPISLTHEESDIFKNSDQNTIEIPNTLPFLVHDLVDQKSKSILSYFSASFGFFEPPMIHFTSLWLHFLNLPVEFFLLKVKFLPYDWTSRHWKKKQLRLPLCNSFLLGYWDWLWEAFSLFPRGDAACLGLYRLEVWRNEGVTEEEGEVEQSPGTFEDELFPRCTLNSFTVRSVSGTIAHYSFLSRLPSTSITFLPALIRTT